MKNKFLLLTLPILLAMSGCQSARVVDQPKNKALISEMTEDTLAHEEVFGGAESAHIFVPKANPSKATLVESSVKVGCQIQFNDKNTESTADDTISIRFLAALTDSNVTAVWHRGLAQPNGYEGAETSTDVWKYKFSGEQNAPDLTSDVKYGALNNGGVRIAAGEKGEYENYECFVIYTLMNIPYEQFKDSYLAAYVTLGSNNSQAFAVKIEKDGDLPKNFFSFDPNVTGHFLQGKINGSTQLIYATEYATGENSAVFSDKDLLATDYFGSFYYSTNGNFQFFGYSDFVQDTANIYFGASSAMSGYSKPKFDGKFNIYISRNSENKVFGYTTAEVDINFAVTKNAGSGYGVFILGEFNSWTISESCRLSWTEGNVWVGTLTLRIGSEYKAVVGLWDASKVEYYEGGDNRIATSETSVNYSW